MLKSLFSRVLLAGVFFAVSPSSSNYVLPSYDIGSGGAANSTSSSYSLNGTAGLQTGGPLNSTSYSLTSGENPTQNANVPPAPTLTNPSNYYNQLLLVLNNANNPSDTKFLVAISSDNFVTTQYVQNDNSIGGSSSLSVYRTYASYGSGSGFLILGLSPSTTYKVKVKAIRGNFTESGYGPTTAGVATSAQTLSFGITTTLTSTPPFTANFSSLTLNSVVTANADINVSLDTNGLLGGAVYIKGNNTGLLSSSQSYTITSTSTDLSLAAKGYGAQVISTSQTSGGPLTGLSPYNGTLDNVGILSNTLQQFVSTSAPVTGAAATLRLKAKTDITVPVTNDFADTLSIVAAVSY